MISDVRDAVRLVIFSCISEMRKIYALKFSMQNGTREKVSLAVVPFREWARGVHFLMPTRSISVGFDLQN